MTLVSELRDKNYELCSSAAFAVNTDGAGAVRVPLAEAFSVVRKGENLANLWLKDMYGRTLDFCVVPVEGTRPGIKEVQTAKSGYPKAGGTFDVVLDSASAGDTLQAEVHDGYDRLIWSDSRRVDGGKARFNMDTSDAKSSGVFLSVTLKNAGKIVDVVKKPVACGLDDFDHKVEEFVFDVWGEAPFQFNRPWALHALKTQRDVGVVGSTAYANYYASQKLSDEEWDGVLDDFFGTLAVHGIRPIFQYSAGVLSYLARAEDNRLWRPADESRMVLGDDAFVSQYVWHVNRNADVAKKWGVDTYLSGDEQQSWMSYAPKNIEAFRKWMEQSYAGDLSRFNRSWGTSYKSFGETQPAELGNISETLARSDVEVGGGGVAGEISKDDLRAGDGDEIYTFAPWLEYRLYMDKLFADIHGATLESLQERDSKFRFGIEGTRYAGAIGFDWPYLLEKVNYVTCYDEPVQAEVISTFTDALPLVTSKKHGAGRAVFVNSYLSNYKVYLPDPLPGPYHDPMAGRESMARAYREVFRKALGEDYPLRAVTITTPYYPEKSAPYYRIGKFVGSDNVVYYPLVQESFRTSYYVPQESRMQKGQGLDCTLKLDTSGHIYDVREKRYIGFGDEVKANI